MEQKRFDEAVLRMAQRQTVRSFRDEPIPDEVLKNILEAGINTASGGNLQPYSIIVERDREKAQKLAKMLNYPFIGNAAVNLLVLMDWHKLAVYSKCRQAPFIENYSTNHFFIAWDDAVLCAQAMETAAWLYGIGTCFIGHVMDCGDALKSMYHLPDMTYPVLLLSMGYPKNLTPKSRKLSLDLMVFEGEYPALREEQICDAFDQKYEGKKPPLPSDENARAERISKFRRAMEMVYSAEETEKIIQEVIHRGYFSEIQRLFGIHYHPDREVGNELLGYFQEHKLYPFTDALNKQEEK